MEPFELKIGQRTYTITDEDKVMFNGNCYQLITRYYRRGWDKITPKLSKAKAEKYIKQGFLVESSRTDSYGLELVYYRFTGCPEV